MLKSRRRRQEEREQRIAALEAWDAAYARAVDAGADAAQALERADAALAAEKERRSPAKARAKARVVAQKCQVCGGFGHDCRTVWGGGGAQDAVCSACNYRYHAQHRFQRPAAAAAPVSAAAPSPPPSARPRARLSALAERVA